MGWGRTHDLAGAGRYIEESGVIVACPGEVGHGSGLHWESIYLPGLYRERLSMHLLLLGGTKICTWHVLGRLVYMCSLMGWAHLGSGVKLLA